MKQASITLTAIAVILSILSFLTIFSFLTDSGDYVSSKADDIACRTFLQAKATDVNKIGEFFYNLNFRCEKDRLEWEDPADEEQVFGTVADRMHSCWRRYGEGSYDFMSNFNTEGRWCFTCGSIEASDTGETYAFSDFIEWSKETPLPENESQNYYSAMNLQHANYSAGEAEYQDLATSLAEMKAQAVAEEDPMYNAFLGYLDEQYTSLLDLRAKKIDTSEKTYIVYRYDRAENSFSQTANNIATSAAYGAAGGVAIGVASSIVTGPIGIAATLTNLVKKGKQVQKISKVIRLFKKLKQFSKLGAVGATAGGVAGSEMNLNEVQYVDLMTQEQYYRQCGSEPPRPQGN